MNILGKNKNLNFLLKLFILTLLYFFTGKLGLYLAIPPGYATSIWPPSGIALALLLLWGYRFWPGILFGSFILNFLLFHSVEQGFEKNKILIAFFIALSSSLQNLFIAYLIKRFISFPFLLEKIKKTFLLLLVILPLGCCVAATGGVATLYLFKQIELKHFLSNWLTWWSGDLFGAFVFLPLTLLFPSFASVLKWRGKVVKTLSSLGFLVLIIPLAATFYTWKISSNYIFENNKDDFKQLAEENERALLYRIDSYEQSLLGGVGFFQGSENVNQNEWKQYVNEIELLKRFPGINGLGYIKKVVPQDLSHFVQQMQKEVGSSFHIHPEVSVPHYFIISYIEPQDKNKEAIGLNISFEKNRYDAAMKAAENDETVITKKIALVQDHSNSPGFLLFHPIYKKNSLISTKEERLKSFSGWIYAPMIGNDFLNQLTNSQNKTLELEVYDDANQESSHLIYSSNKKNTAEKTEPLFKVVKDVEIKKQVFTLVWKSTPLFEKYASSYTPQIILVSGLLFSTLFCVFLLMMNGREASIQKKVKEQTEELRISQNLINKANLELAQSNKELEQFAYIASHDLQEPLRKIHSFTALLTESLEGKLDEKSKKHFFFLSDAAQRMQILIRDVLEFSRLAKRDLSLKKVSIRSLVDQSIKNIELFLLEKKAVIVIDPLPELDVSPSLITQVFQNIISNAVKFTPPQHTPRVHISYRFINDEHVFNVRDNGIGIEKEFLEKIFEIFQRLNSRSEYAGSGIGLAICKRIVERHGGRMWAESSVGEGSVFYFTLPENIS